jgi:hypothetical protein
MTPEKILDYSVKFGLLPFVLWQLYINRADNQLIKEDVKELQVLLIDCYRDQLQTRPLHTTNRVDEPTRLFAILPKEIKICKN